MGSNGKTGQLKGPFNANQELMDLIIQDAKQKPRFVEHLGVQAEFANIILINDKEFEIGASHIYELGNTEIRSIKFKTDVNENTILDYTIII